jgi:histidyl-tRNA synthetase
MSEARTSFSAPIGTHDVLAPDTDRWQALVTTFAELAGLAGFGLLVSPAFEEIGVFQRVGPGTDVVRKEMYDFADKGDRHLALRPEGTASVVRAYVQHRPQVPWRSWYVAPMFRYEKPQAGRYRQHHQVGAEVLGSADPDLDVELIGLLWDFYAALGLRRLDVVVNSMGDPEGRQRFAAELRAHLEAHLDALAPEDRDKVAEHPLRVLDSKRPATIEVTSAAPQMLDHLSAEAVAHFERVQAGLRAAQIPFRIEPRLVRGLDYYTHTLFEVQSSALDAAQNAVGGGGRYDGLAEALGGPPTPGVGFGAGIERILLACDAEGVFAATNGGPQVFVIDTTGGEAARDLVLRLRRAGVRAERAYDARSMKAQMKAADRSGATLAAIIGSDEAAAGTVTLRDLRAGEQRAVPADDVVDDIRSATT